MATSTLVFIQFINRILLSIGERPVEGLQSYPAQKCQQAIENALLSLFEANDWQFLHSHVVSSDWTTGVADHRRMELPVHQRILSITYLPDNTNLTELSYDSFIQLKPIEGKPRFWTMDDTYDGVLVHPYPEITNGTNTDLVTELVVYPSVYSLGLNDNLPIPNALTRYVETYATALMKQNHLDDGSAAQLDFQRAEMMLVNLIRRGVNGSRGQGQRNMWRGSRPYGA